MDLVYYPAVVNVHEAKTHFSKLIQRAEAGETILIARSGKPVARLGPLEPEPQPRLLGRHRGEMRIPEDFDAPLVGFETR
jgi:prevent-host-death family protein